ncbi:hypothetical protein A3D80_00960 [Candidatus Roizmanbacteria bacterium RIFCSPHIGHO2_02_FULL_40_13b]|uniref:Uncharacterized protein n=1 Tax=Candidatus Roizmanbacteria bacterium RIFCSPHIGHO2_01_FULL_39_24 TaxID=1802032 RepID=A0A1F7GJK9_9BACT|nr:MAG: hypothetical protein A2799_02325 [Candidatus Roizmanbacteria bacterium RIFCSPHIGHO2_01_FULL_39_24]OGK26265.1 MAG: hypothetical protein A3D80_00960 [Candidatus Roizmanbacteria bacterium RIFCSPHIGHO2_02_FULL_40_13b]OGK48900.1 MAG: hypothetical protein A3A56_01720 [Candidatus Roizmanbacteria bacterium RIFCSPLOWO2_01_FULL_40_32]OGK57567.1 MAG: hypothetical protein A3H83_01955 [Candidatus Roizmanbacteria bacterium RIFCSPLOWO2_02_FULL_39_8]
MNREKEGPVATPDDLSAYYRWTPVTLIQTPIYVIPSSNTREIAVFADGKGMNTFKADPVTRQFLGDIITLTDVAVIKRLIPTLQIDTLAERMDRPNGTNLWYETVVEMTERGVIIPVDEQSIILAVSPIVLATVLEKDKNVALKLEPEWWRGINPPLMDKTDITLLIWLEQKIKARVATSGKPTDDQPIAVSMEGLFRYMDPEVVMERIHRLIPYGFFILGKNQLLIRPQERHTISIFFQILGQQFKLPKKVLDYDQSQVGGK